MTERLLVSAGARKPKRRFLFALAWLAAGIMLGVLVVRVFLGDVYPVSTSSMRPTIFGGADESGGSVEKEWVFVSFDRSAPRRFDLVVVTPENGGEPLVKRALGLPGEGVRLALGDFYVNGSPVGAEAAGLVPLWDTEFQPWAEWWNVPAESEGPWSKSGGVLTLDGIASPEVSAPAVFHLQARDGYLAPDGRRVQGVQEVNDLVLELTLTLDEIGDAADAALSLSVTEAGDAFTLTVLPDASAAGGFTALLTRSSTEELTPDLREGRSRGGQEVDFIARGSLPLELGRSHVLALSNVDDVLRVTLDGRDVLADSTERNRPHARAGSGSVHVPPRARFTGAGLRARFTRARILRDLHWAPSGQFGVQEELLLGRDEVFVVGDNSRASTDSRRFGPVKLERITGRAEAVIWPPRRWRKLR